MIDLQTHPGFVITLGQAYRFRYRNWRGEEAVRHARLEGLRWGVSQWHSEPQWLVRGFDLDREEVREFALRDMVPVDA